MRRIFVVVIGYIPSESARAVNLCNRLCLILRLQGYETKKIFVDNSPTRECSPSRGWETLAGSNSFAEFSGYQEGLNHIRAGYILNDSDTCLFVNDTINSHRNFSKLKELHLARMLVGLPKCSFGGYIGTHDWAGFTIGSMPITEWVSTYAFALDTQSLDKLDYRIEHRELLESISNDNLSGIISNVYPVSDPLRDYIMKWLSDGWYNAKPIHMWDPARLKLKLACILNEMLLSANCQGNSVRIVDFQDSYVKFKSQFSYFISLIELFRKIFRLYPKLSYKG